MRDKKRTENKLLEEAYGDVYNEMNTGNASQTASIGAQGPIIAIPADEVAIAADEESCGSVEPDISALAAQAIAAITELATAAGANISVTVEEQQDEVHEVEVIDQFNTGYEDVEST